MTERLTAEQVKAMPAGSTVTLHGRDRHGEHTQLECVVCRSGRKKVLAYPGINGLRETKPIRALDGETHYYTRGGAAW